MPRSACFNTPMCDLHHRSVGYGDGHETPRQIRFSVEMLLATSCPTPAETQQTTSPPPSHGWALIEQGVILLTGSRDISHGSSKVPLRT